MRIILISLFTFLSTTASAAVWTHTNQWNAQWEREFSEWVRLNWRKDFFSREYTSNGQKNPYYGLRVDCADTVYSMRIVFAYEHSLPFIMQDPTASGKTLSNSMKRWDKNGEISRVRSFLTYVYGIASTRSLPNDTYPIAITKSTVKAGSLILTTQKNHHSWTVKNMLSIGVPHLIYNSVVGSHSSTILQERKSWPNPEWVFEGNFSASGNAGFRYWRPHDYINQPVWKVPGYSEEQYGIPLKSWVKQVQKRLASSEESDEDKTQRLLSDLCEGFTSRVVSVNEAIPYSDHSNQCLNAQMYDNLSTPSRDRRVFDDFIALRLTYKEMLDKNGGNSLSADTKDQLNKIYPAIQKRVKTEHQQMSRQYIDDRSVCVKTYLPGKAMDLSEFKRRLFDGLISTNPNDSSPYRWGDYRGPSDKAKRCQNWGTWLPNLNNY